MKYYFSLLILIFLTSHASSQSTPAKSVYGRLDTIIEYDYKQRAAIKPSSEGHYMNGTLTSDIASSNAEVSRKEFANCKPCVVKTYNKDEVLVRIAVQYSDCPAGDYIDYYPNGKIKTRGQFRSNPSGDWKTFIKQGHCGEKEGRWLYYGIYGNVLKLEDYRNDTLVYKKEVPPEQ